MLRDAPTKKAGGRRIIKKKTMNEKD